MLGLVDDEHRYRPGFVRKGCQRRAKRDPFGQSNLVQRKRQPTNGDLIQAATSRQSGDDAFALGQCLANGGDDDVPRVCGPICPEVRIDDKCTVPLK